MVQKLPNWQSVKIPSKLYTTSPYKRNLTLYILCISLTCSFHIPETPPYPQQFNKFSYNFHISLNLVNIPVHTLPWPYYTIITVRTFNPYKTQKDPSGTQTSEEKKKSISHGGNTIYIIRLKCQPQSVNNKYYTIYY